VRRAGVEPAQRYAGGLQPLRLANAQPTHVLAVARVGIEPTDDHQGLSLAALPVCVPCWQTSSMGFEPMASTVTEWRALRTAPRGQVSVAQVGVEPTASLVLREGGLPFAYRATHLRQFRGLESNQHQRVQSPMSYRLDDPGISQLLDTATLAQVRGEGVEPSSPGSKPGSLPVSRSPIESALWESNPPGWFGRPVPSPLGQGHKKRKERELNPQGSSLGRFRDGCHRQLACPSV
jgi:hypothetical protein